MEYDIKSKKDLYLILESWINHFLDEKRVDQNDEFISKFKTLDAVVFGPVPDRVNNEEARIYHDIQIRLIVYSKLIINGSEPLLDNYLNLIKDNFKKLVKP